MLFSGKKNKMKLLLPLFLILFTVSVFSQNLQIEKDYLIKKLSIDRISQEEIKESYDKFLKVVNDIGGYPELPISSDGYYFEKTIEIEQKSKAEIFKDLLEWIAINYGSIKNVLHYKDEDRGVLIVKGNFDIYTKRVLFGFIDFGKISKVTCSHTVSIRVNDNKINFKFNDIVYEAKYTDGSGAYSYYEYSLNEITPVTKLKSKNWERGMLTIKETNQRINNYFDSIKKYVELNKSF